MRRLGDLGAGLYRIIVREWLSHSDNDPLQMAGATWAIRQYLRSAAEQELIQAQARMIGAISEAIGRGDTKTVKAAEKIAPAILSGAKVSLSERGSMVICKRLRTYHPLLENITRVRLGLAENEAAVLLGFSENILGLTENSLRTSGCARIQ